MNIAPPTIQTKWFRTVGMPLGNFTETYPAGDNVQSIEPWIAPDTWAGTDHVILNLILDDIDAGLPNGQRYSHVNAPKNGPRGPLSGNTAPIKKKLSAALSSWPGSKAAP